MFCSKCGTSNDTGSFCTSCGAALAPTSQPAAPWATSPSPTQPSQAWQAPPSAQSNWQTPPLRPVSPGNGLSTAAFILGAIAFLFFPIVFGPAAIICAAVAKSKSEPNADMALLVAILGTVVGFILGAMFFSF